jgi:hypothetical protein
VSGPKTLKIVAKTSSEKPVFNKQRCAILQGTLLFIDARSEYQILKGNSPPDSVERGILLNSLATVSSSTGNTNRLIYSQLEYTWLPLSVTGQHYGIWEINAMPVHGYRRFT